jgi:hypothetical protein
MAEITPTSRYVLPLGPIKMEILQLADVTDADTVVTQMQNPEFGFGVCYTDASPMTAAINPSISGRTVTLNSTDLSGDDDLVLVMFGW